MSNWSQATQFDQSTAIEEIVFFANRLLEGSRPVRLLVGEDGFGRSMLLDLARHTVCAKQAAVLTVSVVPQDGYGWGLDPDFATGLAQGGHQGLKAMAALLDRFFAGVRAQANRHRGDEHAIIRKRLEVLRPLTGGRHLSHRLLSYWQAYGEGDQRQMALALSQLGQPVAGISPIDQLSLMSVLCQLSGVAGVLIILRGEDDASLMQAFDAVSNFAQPGCPSDLFLQRMGFLVVANPAALHRRESQALMDISPHAMRSAIEQGGRLVTQIHRLSINVPRLCVEDYLRA
ncbi:hypothetical protein FDK21_00150 [Cohaesibacter sp. CAU 1516]|uniref:BREX system ATP-binding domain-containing protein n=1 Tax=Cohaesibacter sp. CAU 1516 TaxID=2576038 RepID=UPI0010FF3D9E|nr:BREX system ATP-binding domain-containing protein [Cohaesibacter sp. CAU 1516]TLP48123.1 hypothetical protein FDK21_00150 [Cohaesibacter sp. CAU 1516]